MPDLREYPAVPAGDRGNNEYQYLVPTAIEDGYNWVLLDTGANQTTLMFAAAKHLGIDPGQLDREGIGRFVGGFPYPYARTHLDIHILPPNEALANDFFLIYAEPNISISDYYTSGPIPYFTLHDVPCRIITKPLSRIASEADFDHPHLYSRNQPSPFVLGGIEDFLDRMYFVLSEPSIFSIGPLDNDLI